MKRERTPWFRWPIRPVRPGWYEYRGMALDEDSRYYWNGTQWGFWNSRRTRDWWQLADDEGDAWRGLKELAA